MFCEIKLAQINKFNLNECQGISITLTKYHIQWSGSDEIKKYTADNGNSNLAITKSKQDDQHHVIRINLSALKPDIRQRLQQYITGGETAQKIGGYPAFWIGCTCLVEGEISHKTITIGEKVHYQNLYFYDNNNREREFAQYFEYLSEQIDKKFAGLHGQYFAFSANERPQSIQNLLTKQQEETQSILTIHQNRDYTIDINADFLLIKNNVKLQNDNLTLQQLGTNYSGQVEMSNPNGLIKQQTVVGDFQKIDLKLNTSDDVIAEGWRISITGIPLGSQTEQNVTLRLSEFTILDLGENDPPIESGFFNTLIINVKTCIVETSHTLLLDMGSSASVVARITHTKVNGNRENKGNFNFLNINPRSDNNQFIDESIIILNNPIKSPTNDSIDDDIVHDVDNDAQYVQGAEDTSLLFADLENRTNNQNAKNQPNQDDAYAIENHEHLSPALFGLTQLDDASTVTHLNNRGLYRKFAYPQLNNEAHHSLIQNTKNYLRYPQFNTMYSIVRHEHNDSIQEIRMGQGRNTKALLKACYASQLGLTAPPLYEAVSQAGVSKQGVFGDESYNYVLIALPNILRYQNPIEDRSGPANIICDLLNSTTNKIFADFKPNKNIYFIPEANAVLFKHLEQTKCPKGEYEDYIVIDIGAGTTDITFARLKNDTDEQGGKQRLFIAAQASSHKAGNYIDYMLAHYFYRYLVTVKGQDENAIQAYNPDMFVEYCLGSQQELHAIRPLKTYIEYIKRGRTGDEFSTYGLFEHEFKEFYDYFLKFHKLNIEGQADKAQEIHPKANDIFREFFYEIKQMIDGYIEAVLRVGHKNLQQFRGEPHTTKIIASGRASLWQPIQYLLHSQSMTAKHELIQADDGKERKYQVCEGLASSLRWRPVNDLETTKVDDDYIYYDKTSYHYPLVYIIALGHYSGPNADPNELKWDFSYEISEANKKLSTQKKCHKIIIYCGLYLMGSPNEEECLSRKDLEEFVKQDQPNPNMLDPYFPLQKIGGFMDQHHILQMCQADFHPQERHYQKLSLEVDKEQNLSLNLCCGDKKAVIFPYATQQSLLDEAINIREVLPMSFYRSNWPNPVIYQPN